MPDSPIFKELVTGSLLNLRLPTFSGYSKEIGYLPCDCQVVIAFRVGVPPKDPILVSQPSLSIILVDRLPQYRDLIHSYLLRGTLFQTLATAASGGHYSVA